MSDKDLQIAALQRREQELLKLRADDIASLEFYKLREEELITANQAVHNQLRFADDRTEELREANAAQCLKISAIMDARRSVEDSVIEATATYGKENDSCRAGMAAFLAAALGIGQDDALDRLARFFKETIEITITATVSGREHDHVTVDEAAEFIADVLGIEGDDIENVQTNVRIEDV